MKMVLTREKLRSLENSDLSRLGSARSAIHKILSRNKPAQACLHLYLCTALGYAWGLSLRPVQRYAERFASPHSTDRILLGENRQPTGNGGQPMDIGGHDGSRYTTGVSHMGILRQLDICIPLVFPRVNCRYVCEFQDRQVTRTKFDCQLIILMCVSCTFDQLVDTTRYNAFQNDIRARCRVPK